MGKTSLNREMVNAICAKIKELREENNIVNVILRNDVFRLLEAQKNCTVLYYPLKDDGIDGFRISKYVKDKYEEFVFINTAQKEDVQIFTAAHELGHIVGIDRIICDEFDITDVTKKLKEDIIDRFAAELLMDRAAFSKLAGAKISEYVTKNGQITLSNMLRLITYLMDSFMAPYEAVVRRFHEMGRIDEKTMLYLSSADVVTEEQIERFSEEGNYKRIKATNTKSFGELAIYLEKLDNADKISEKRLGQIMEQFELRDFGIELPEDTEIQLDKGSEYD